MSGVKKKYFQTTLLVFWIDCWMGTTTGYDLALEVI